MKKLLLFALPAILLLSCSADENVIAEKFPNSEVLGKAARIAWQDFKIPVPKMFSYSSANEAAVQIGERVKFLETEIRQELAKRPECDHVIVNLYLYEGKASLGSVVFGDTREAVFRESFIILDSGFAPYPRGVYDTAHYQKYMDSTHEHYQMFDIGKRSTNELKNFIAEKLTNENNAVSFVIDINAETMSLYGYKG